MSRTTNHPMTDAAADQQVKESTRIETDEMEISHERKPSTQENEEDEDDDNQEEFEDDEEEGETLESDAMGATGEYQPQTVFTATVAPTGTTVVASVVASVSATPGTNDPEDSYAFLSKAAARSIIDLMKGSKYLSAKDIEWILVEGKPLEMRALLQERFRHAAKEMPTPAMRHFFSTAHVIHAYPGGEYLIRFYPVPGTIDSHTSSTAVASNSRLGGSAAQSDLVHCEALLSQLTTALTNNEVAQREYEYSCVADSGRINFDTAHALMTERIRIKTEIQRQRERLAPLQLRQETPSPSSSVNLLVRWSESETDEEQDSKRLMKVTISLVGSSATSDHGAGASSSMAPKMTPSDSDLFDACEETPVVMDCGAHGMTGGNGQKVYEWLQDMGALPKGIFIPSSPTGFFGILPGFPGGGRFPAPQPISVDSMEDVPPRFRSDRAPQPGGQLSSRFVPRSPYWATFHPIFLFSNAAALTGSDDSPTLVFNFLNTIIGSCGTDGSSLSQYFLQERLRESIRPR